MNIAICDDDNQELLRLSSLMEEYQYERQLEFTYQTFQTGTDLLSVMHGGAYDILFLDILMPGPNGIETAREIREFDSEVKIVFLTSSKEFAVDGYDIHAYQYLLKPTTKKMLFPVLDILLDELKKPEESICLKTQSSILKVPFQRIEYLEINNKRLYFHLTNGKVHEITGKLSDYENEFLTRPEFIKVHRSYLVNMHWIQELSVKGIVLASSEKVPIARLGYSQVRDDYMTFVFNEKGVH